MYNPSAIIEVDTGGWLVPVFGRSALQGGHPGHTTFDLPTVAAIALASAYLVYMYFLFFFLSEFQLSVRVSALNDFCPFSSGQIYVLHTGVR